jgi:hypothetical protein
MQSQTAASEGLGMLRLGPLHRVTRAAGNVLHVGQGLVPLTRCYARAFDTALCPCTQYLLMPNHSI